VKAVPVLCLSFFLFTLGAARVGAAPSLVYSTSLNFVWDVAVDSAGNAYVLGQMSSTYGYFVAKLNPSGALIFQRPFNLLGRAPSAIAIDPAGYIYIAGTANLTDQGSEANLAFVAKLSQDGSEVLYETFFAGARDDTEGIDLAVDPFGQAYLHYSANYSQFVWVAIFDPAGSFSREYAGSLYFLTGMALGPSGDLFAVGWAPPADDPQAYMNPYLGRMDASSGAVVETLIDDSGTLDFPLDVAATPGDGSVVVGKKGEGVYVAELGPAGQKIFSRVLDLGAVEIRDVAVTSSGQIVLAGFMTPDVGNAFVLRLKGGTGEVISSMSLGGAYAVAVGPGDDAYVAGGGFVARIRENRPPACSGATASPSSIWPPDRRQVRISTLGVTDPDGDPVILKVTRILQDELFTARMPDAGSLGTAKPWVRADRMDNGDGRVYHLYFEATDPAGASCTGEVKVCVPIQSGGTCRDGGARFDSTVPR
jgi:hypothetical protein